MVVLYRDSIIISFIDSALNGIDVCIEDIKNDYLQELSSQNYFIIWGKDFGLENISKHTLIRRAL